VKVWIDPTNFGDVRNGEDNTVRVIEVDDEEVKRELERDKPKKAKKVKKKKKK